MPKSTMANWIRAYKAWRLEEVGKLQRPLAEVEQELTRVKRELAVVRMKRDILKKAAVPTQVWVSDISYISTKEGWLYLAGHKDIFNGEIVGHAMASRMIREPGQPVSVSGSGS